MTDSSSSEIELEPYKEIQKMNYSTPMASRASSPLSHDKNESSTTHFNGPVVKCSESEVVSTSTGLVASVTWPDLRYPCSLSSGVTEGGRRGQLPPGAAGKGAQNSLANNIL